jgi:hypothetical protein
MGDSFEFRGYFFPLYLFYYTLIIGIIGIIGIINTINIIRIIHTVGDSENIKYYV